MVGGSGTGYLSMAYGDDVDAVIAAVKERDTPANAGRTQHRFNVLVREIERLRGAPDGGSPFSPGPCDGQPAVDLLLDWTPSGRGAFAACGERGHGVACSRMDDIVAVWAVTMDPGDPSSRVWDYAASLEGGKMCAERQAMAWPSLIPGARTVP